MDEQEKDTKLMPCRKCKTMVEPSITQCPECGVVNPAMTSGQITLGLIMLIAMIAAVLFLFSTCQGGSDDELSIEDQQRRGFHCLHSWDGAHVEFMRDVKSKMRDPASFKHVETRITSRNKNGKHVIFMDYRAKNGFGGVNIATAKGIVDNTTCKHIITQLE